MRRLALLLCVLVLLSLCACTFPSSPGTTDPPPPETASPTPTVSPATPEPTPEPTPDPTAEPTPEPLSEPDAVLAVNGEELPARSFREELSDGVGFTCLLPAEAVTAEYAHNAWVIAPVSDPEAAWLELSFVFGGEGESLLPGLMDGYLDFTGIEFSEAPNLGLVRANVGLVTATDGIRQARGWLLDAGEGCVTAVLVCRLDRLEQEGTLLQAVLDTFDLT